MAITSGFPGTTTDGISIIYILFAIVKSVGILKLKSAEIGE